MELLAKIQRELKVPKGQFNSFSKYHYRNCEDILEAVKPLLGKGTLVLQDELANVNDRVYIKAYAILTDENGTQAIAHAYAREAHDKKGMDEAQITGAASSYARKYALCGLFCIDDGKDADADDNTTAKPQKANDPGKFAKPVPPKQVADKRKVQKKRIQELVDGIVLEPLDQTPEAYGKYIKENTGYELKEENYESIIDALEAQQN